MNMHAPVFQGSSSFRYDEIPIPEIGPGEILLEMKACGLCGTDLHKIRHNTIPAGTVLGHEVTGVVAQIGEGVNKFGIGDRVFVAHHVPCFTCDHCAHGNYSLCRNFKTSNIHPGGFAPFIRIPAENVAHTTRHIPDNLSFADASLTEPLACCIHSIPKLNINPGDHVVVFGAGSVGMLYLQLLQNRHLCHVTVIDINQKRLDRAAALGATTINSTTIDPAQAIAELTSGKGVHAVVLTVPVAELFVTAMSMVSPGGVILSFAPLAAGDTADLDLTRICTEELVIAGAYSSKPYDYTEALELLSRGLVDASSLITHSMPLSDFTEAVELATRRDTPSLKIILLPERNRT